ncbi:MAG: bifunctional methylenetetrahydrofolate dehydrogenase/methenyltetrahydrofolate cyclohydrolase FolD [Legionella sp.]|nr:MAG: bifunctional methylenetetrahydrofolate dehydrogenase/methenyltetrahydrofolate cyclohydrolase FolD [Legionella sp.]PJD99263.1 MAG: bifunctional methylenetetrahydrofolate dehydrogenase/methenyltetrahydrofolate cyclohydrolase FolD [Legionella sp.]
MTALLLNGKEVAALKKEQIKERIKTHIDKGHQAPGLAVILVGTDPASFIYVNNKKKACAEVGIRSHAYHLPEDTTENKLLELIDTLNESNEIQGILVQLPLPQQINTMRVLERISYQKDVDGFHPYNMGRLIQKNPLLRPSTPLGIMSLLKHYHLDVKGKHAVIIGASNIVGRPASMELLLEGATITVCHRQTPNLEPFVRMADILVVAAGVIDVVKPEWLNKNQIIIDVGIHRLANGTLRGDVDFEETKKRVACITPVPGGVGPMTIVSLLENTLTAAGVS